MDNSVLLRVAVIENKPDGVKLIMSRGLNVNSVLSKSGPTAGYTALHWACAKNHINLVKMLIDDYKADVNSVADDGIQPLLLASFLGHLDIIDFLLKSGADPNATYGKSVHIKYIKNTEWSDDFGGKMSLLAFAVLNNKAYLASSLLDHAADVEVRSDKKQKTLLMWAVEKGNYQVAQEIALKIKDKGNGDPDTLLVNMAAYRGCYDLLKTLINLGRPLSTESRALKYVTLLVDGASELEEKKEISTRWILKDLVLRRSFGLFVPEEEKKLMDEMVDRNDNIKKIVRDFEQRFVEEFLKKRVVGQSSLYEVATKIMNGKKEPDIWSFIDNIQEELDENDGHFEEIDDPDEYDVQNFVNALASRAEKLEKRRQLMEEVQKIKNLKKAIPLPYEIVLEIIKYLDNEDLEKFVQAFFI